MNNLMRTNVNYLHPRDPAKEIIRTALGLDISQMNDCAFSRPYARRQRRSDDGPIINCTSIEKINIARKTRVVLFAQQDARAPEDALKLKCRESRTRRIRAARVDRCGCARERMFN